MSDEKPQAATAELKENAKKWEMVFGDIQKLGYVGTAEMLKSLRRKAELWDQYAIYDNDNEPEILVKDLIIAYEKLGVVKDLVLSGPLVNVDTLEECQQAVDDWLGKLVNVLEGEE